MNLEFTPLLAAQRELYRIPRGPARFGAYARMMRDDPKAAPLVALNPMARGHVPALIDALIGLDADRVASEAVAEAAARLADAPGEYRIGLVVADDVGGGWTNRCASEFASAAGSPAAIRPGWLAGVLWSSEPASARAVREAVLTPIHRAAYVQRHGPARTLREFLTQEGRALADAGCEAPTLEADDLAYTRSVLKPHLDEALARTVMECLYGDEAGRTLGFTPRGLCPRAGLALALHEARQAPPRR